MFLKYWWVVDIVCVMKQALVMGHSGFDFKLYAHGGIRSPFCPSVSFSMKWEQEYL